MDVGVGCGEPGRRRRWLARTTTSARTAAAAWVQQADG
jgi:hypothetical protein